MTGALASLLGGMFIGSFFINRHTVEICELLTNHPLAKGHVYEQDQ